MAVTAPARLHLGFFNLNGDLGRRFGGLGITLEKPVTRVVARAGGSLRADGPSADRAVTFAQRIGAGFGLDNRCRIDVERAIPQHSGLGSGTQLALATGIAVARLQGLDLAPRVVARILDRGQRSGIGIGAFESGGVLLDGGKADADATPPILARFDFPAKWRIVLILDHGFRGIHGAKETEAFAKLASFPATLAAELCRVVLMRALPAIAEANIDAFGRAVATLQRAVGDHFAPVQGGRYASARVAGVLDWLRSNGIAGIGQSSWGPTGFALVDGVATAKELVAAARLRWAADAGLEFAICRGSNVGGQVEVRESVDAEQG